MHHRRVVLRVPCKPAAGSRLMLAVLLMASLGFGFGEPTIAPQERLVLDLTKKHPPGAEAMGDPGSPMA